MKYDKKFKNIVECLQIESKEESKKFEDSRLLYWDDMKNILEIFEKNISDTYKGMMIDSFSENMKFIESYADNINKDLKEIEKLLEY